MKIRIMATALLLCALCGCGGTDWAALPPPDLTGNWTQVGGEDTNFYQIATITEDTIECYWHVTKDNSEYLYWSGSYLPPEEGTKTYSWTSANNLKRALTSSWALRDESKTFNYNQETDQLTYIINMGNLRMTVALERAK